jgi:hypothetical protein
MPRFFFHIRFSIATPGITVSYSLSRPWQGAGSASYKLDRGVQEREGGNDQKLEIRKATIFAKLLRCGSHLTVRA